jgi:hypothetical protein
MKVNRCLRGKYRLHLHGWRAFRARNSLALKLGAIYFFNTSVDLHWTTWRYRPEDRNIYCGVFKSLCLRITIERKVCKLLLSFKWILDTLTIPCHLPRMIPVGEQNPKLPRTIDAKNTEPTLRYA